MLAEKSIKMEKARHVFKAKEEYFIQNGAMLLEKQITCNQGRDTEPIKIFSAKEIQQATNNFDPNLILGSDIATIYKGILDEREVAIKVKGPPICCSTETMVDFFLQQVTIKQLINHKNVVRHYGCCLETEIPMLVLEFIPNGTLFDQLHGHHNKINCQISWLDRVRIASETSYALCYMHYGRLRPIVHLDVKSTNIFLDEFLTAKLSNFGFAVSIAPGEDFFQGSSVPLGEDFFQGSSVRGTYRYVDPEYQATLQVTDKCDVYSFGVVLVEVLTGHYPTEMFLRHNNLVDYFVLSMEENRIFQIVANVVLDQGSNEDIQAFAELALRCVKNKGDERPSMREVTIELKRILQLVRSKDSKLSNETGSTLTRLA